MILHELAFHSRWIQTEKNVVSIPRVQIVRGLAFHGISLNETSDDDAWDPAELHRREEGVEAHGQVEDRATSHRDHARHDHGRPSGLRDLVERLVAGGSESSVHAGVHEPSMQGSGDVPAAGQQDEPFLDACQGEHHGDELDRGGEQHEQLQATDQRGRGLW